MKLPFILLQALGVFIVFKGTMVLLSEVRGVDVTIYELGILIPANDRGVYTFGTVFVAMGLLLLFLPELIKKFTKNQKS
ncbi:hypothetical protein [Paenibacillus agricola]|uniref:Uncharacterized protein n=1 Tax=Paenibacillus agricola TaxID=2716264 RepID=A0ABX0IZB2_9BACL|nr:hypothetical protein [Paenibacillus agricola]NHN29315.1 hypothetical protein [Paenibacillus agricola]